LAAATAAAVPTAASQGIEDLSYLAGYFLDAGIALFHPGKDLPDILAVLSNLVHLSEDNLAQGSDHPSHFGILAPQIIDPCANLGEPSGRPVHVVAKDPRQACECQPILRIRHLPRSPEPSGSVKAARSNSRPSSQ
jgi:hypothetical protein